MSWNSKKSLYAFMLKTALKKDTSQSNEYPRATLKYIQVKKKKNILGNFCFVYLLVFAKWDIIDQWRSNKS